MSGEKNEPFWSSMVEVAKRAASRVLGRKADAIDDVAQEAVLEAHEAVTQGRRVGPGFVAKVAYRMAINRVRESELEQDRQADYAASLDIQKSDHVWEHFEQLRHQKQLEALEQFLDESPPGWMTKIQLSILRLIRSGMPVTAIAEVLGVTPKTVRRHRDSAMRRLRQEIRSGGQ